MTNDIVQWTQEELEVWVSGAPIFLSNSQFHFFEKHTQKRACSVHIHTRQAAQGLLLAVGWCWPLIVWVFDSVSHFYSQFRGCFLPLDPEQGLFNSRTLSDLSYPLGWPSLGPQELMVGLGSPYDPAHPSPVLPRGSPATGLKSTPERPLAVAVASLHLDC